MSAYFAPAFFSYLLGICLKRSNLLLEVSKLGFVVIGTFMILWWPYLQSKDAFFEVLSRLAPFERVHEKSIVYTATSSACKFACLWRAFHLPLVYSFCYAVHAPYSRAG